jgi:hypothetical protein
MNINDLHLLESITACGIAGIYEVVRFRRRSKLRIEGIDARLIDVILAKNGKHKNGAIK